MNLRAEILKEHSKAQCLKIVSWVGSSPDRFRQLLQLFLNDEYRVTQRAAWPISYCAIENPTLAEKELHSIIHNLKKPGIHQAVKRNTVRLLQHMQIPEDLHGEVMDFCFKYISDPDEATAVKAFSLSVLGNLSELYPEIIGELKLVIEDGLTYESAAFKVRAKKLLKAFEDRKASKPQR